VFKSSSFYEMLERLWAAMFDLLLKLSNMFKDRRWGTLGGGGREGGTCARSWCGARGAGVLYVVLMVVVMVVVEGNGGWGLVLVAG
jgi:hypothetical protein